MRLSEVMSRDVAVIQPDATLQAAAETMRARDIGLLPVSDGKRLVGVITADDLVAACADGQDPIRSHVQDLMSRELLCCYEDQDVREAVERMRTAPVHRLLVLNRDEELVGVVSLKDVAAEADDADVAAAALKTITDPAEPPPTG